MANYLLSCQCGSQFKIATIDAGKTLICPECEAETVVPNLREIRELPLAEELESSQELTWEKGHGALFATGSILIALGIGLFIFHFFQANQLDLTDESAAQIQYGNVVIDQMPPLTAIQQWRLIRDIGLGEQQVLEYQAKLNEYDGLMLYCYIELGISGLGLALTGIAIFTRRRVNASGSR